MAPSGPATTPAADDLLQEAKWPGSFPPKGTRYLLSVVAGNSRLHWALHQGSSEKEDEHFYPTLFWRTPPIPMESKKEQEVIEDKKETALSQYLPTSVKETLFGKSDRFHEGNENSFSVYSVKEIIQYRVIQRVPALYIYVVSTNPEHAHGLAQLFRYIPCNLFKLSASDLGGDNIVYKGLGIDRVANVAGATFLAPEAPNCLVIDGGTALTYTATTKTSSSNGNTMQLVGGIGPGLRMKLRTHYEYTVHLPHVEGEALKEMVKQCEKDQSPLPLFVGIGNEDEETALQRSIAGNVMREASLMLCDIIRNWLSKCSDKVNNGDGNAEKSLPIVFLTGGDADIFVKLLQPDHSHIVEITAANRTLLSAGKLVDAEKESFEEVNKDASKRFLIVKNSHLQHFGIRSMLKSKYVAITAISDDEELVRSELLGQRVAVPHPAQKKNVLYGTIISSIRNNNLDDDLFSVFYDESGAIDDLSVKVIYDSLLRYTQSEEYSKVKNNEERRMRLQNKAMDATEAAHLLADKSTTVKDLIEQRKPKKRAPPEQAQPASKMMKTNDEEASADVAAAPPPENAFDPQSYVGRRAAKYFDEDLYFGSVREYTPPSENEEGLHLWNVLYDDGDSEDLDQQEVEECLSLYEEKKAKDTGS